MVERWLEDVALEIAVVPGNSDEEIEGRIEEVRGRDM